MTGNLFKATIPGRVVMHEINTEIRNNMSRREQVLSEPATA